jgi:hypothetical protein
VVTTGATYPSASEVPSLIWPWRHALGSALAVASLAAWLASTVAWFVADTVLVASGGGWLGQPAGRAWAAVATGLSAASVTLLLLVMPALGARARPWLTGHRWLLSLLAAVVLPVGLLLATPFAGVREPVPEEVAVMVTFALTLGAPGAVLWLVHLALGRSGTPGRRGRVLSGAVLGALWSATVAAAILV